VDRCGRANRRRLLPRRAGGRSRGSGSAQPPAIRPASAEDLPGIRRLLEDNRLPTEDLAHSLPVLFVARDGPMIVGAGGFEVHGESGLLRSVVVADRIRGTGLGRALVEAVEAAARQRGLRELMLLTETARDFFARLGYADIARESAPEEIRKSAEFKSLCPQSARCMSKRLDVRKLRPWTMVGGFLANRLALALVLLTFNPAGWSYYHWLSGNFPAITPLLAVVGVALLVLWIFLWRSIQRRWPRAPPSRAAPIPTASGS
jgi:N-acetylglutamate synthase-like GNAT family acetyltransferase